MLPTDPIGRSLILTLARDRYERGLASQLFALLEQGLNAAAAQLLREADVSIESRRRLIYIRRQMEAALREQYQRTAKLLSKETLGFAKAEIHQSETWLAAIARETGRTVHKVPVTLAARVSTLPIAGLSPIDWATKLYGDVSSLMWQRVQLGLMNNERVEEIARSLLKDVEGTPSTLRNARTRINAFTRTVVNGISNQSALQSFMEVGAGITSSYRYVAVRDTRTSLICRALDGRIWAYIDPSRRFPPQHPNCRSMIIPIVDAPGYNNPVPSWESFNEWLRKQPASDQDAALGPSRADLFRRKKVVLQDLVDGDNRTFSLAELTALYR